MFVMKGRTGAKFSTLPLKYVHLSQLFYRLHVGWWTRIKNIKDQLNWIAPVSRMHLSSESRPMELKNSDTLHDLGIESDGHFLKLTVDIPEGTHDSIFTLNVAPDIILDKKCSDLVDDVRLGLESMRVPGKTDIMDSSSGVYFMKNAKGQKIAVFKPQDEEQGMPNNPKGYEGNGFGGLRAHFDPGHGYIREFIAYMMDIDNFCSVPATTIVNCEHPVFSYPHSEPHLKLTHRKQDLHSKLFPKSGSLQAFVRAGEAFEDLGYSKLTDFEVQKIALLDMRILNCDRNAANILAIMHQPSPNSDKRGCELTSIKSVENLQGDEEDELEELFDRSISHEEYPEEGVYIGGENISRHESNTSIPSEVDISKKNFKYRHATATGTGSFDIYTAVTYTLIPIDHGYCFPNNLEIADFDWAWYDYPHIDRPTHPLILQYVKTLNIDETLKKITDQVYVSPRALYMIRVVHKLIQDGLANGLTLKQIASMIVRINIEEKSKLEMLLNDAEDNAYRAIEAKNGQWSHISPRGMIPTHISTESSPTPSSLSTSSIKPLVMNGVSVSHSTTYKRSRAVNKSRLSRESSYHRDAEEHTDEMEESDESFPSSDVEPNHLSPLSPLYYSEGSNTAYIRRQISKDKHVHSLGEEVRVMLPISEHTHSLGEEVRVKLPVSDNNSGETSEEASSEKERDESLPMIDDSEDVAQYIDIDYTEPSMISPIDMSSYAQVTPTLMKSKLSFADSKKFLTSFDSNYARSKSPIPITMPIAMNYNMTKITDSPSATMVKSDIKHELTASIPMHRVVSFAGFNSYPLYDIERRFLMPSGVMHQHQSSMEATQFADRGKIKQDRLIWKRMLTERRRQLESTDEFKDMRLRLALFDVKNLIGKLRKLSI